MRLGQSVRRRRGPGLPGPGLRRLATAVVVVLVGWALGWGLATRVLFPSPQLPQTLVQVPDLRGESPEQALGTLEDRGLRLAAVEALQHPVIDSGRIVGQSPLPGQMALPGDSVEVVRSLGPNRRAVPDLNGIRGRRAIELLVATGFDVTVDSLESPLPRGRVLQVEPAVGTSIALPGSVRIAISLGPPVVTMPDLTGLDIGVAQDSVTALGLLSGSVEEVFRFGRDQGRVVEQSPVAGTQVRRGAAVRLVIGRRGG